MQPLKGVHCLAQACISTPYFFFWHTRFKKMDFTEVINAVSQVAFPILCCLIQFYMSYKVTESHTEETNKMTEALNNNNTLLARICDKLDIKVGEE